MTVKWQTKTDRDSVVVEFSSYTRLQTLKARHPVAVRFAQAAAEGVNDAFKSSVVILDWRCYTLTQGS